jgi:3-oxoacyl-[acyl-carrier-protein] synthase II
MAYTARRVVITGIGTVTSVGIGVAAFLEALRSARQNVAPISTFDTQGFAYANGCEVTGFDASQWITRHAVAELGRTARFAVAAARLAVEDAGLGEADLRARTGLVAAGTTDAEARDLDALVEARTRGVRLVDEPAVIARRVWPARLSAAIARELGLSRVEAVTISTACAAGNYAIGHGLDAIRSGECDFALVGGADAAVRRAFAAFYRMGLVAPDVCRPFDVDREGTVVGEGAGFLLLEDLEAARARGARVYAEVLGFGLSCDASHPSIPDLDGIGRCMRLAHQDAQIKPDDVDVISAQAIGTRADVTESEAIRQVFGERTPPVFALKSMLGYTMGAASALAVIACALSIGHGFIPATLNHRATDPACGDLDVVSGTPRPANVRVAQNNALAFGGNNAVVILSGLDEVTR